MTIISGGDQWLFAPDEQGSELLQTSKTNREILNTDHVSNAIERPQIITLEGRLKDIEDRWGRKWKWVMNRC